MLPPTLARRGGPWSRAEVPETRVFRLAFRSWKPGSAASQALQRSVRREAAGPPRHAVPGPPRADARDAVGWLAGPLTDCGDLDELRARADTGDQYAARELAGQLADRGEKRSGCAGPA